MLNELVDEAIGSVSYHLRQLADHGFIHEAPELAKDGRERWWRASHEWTAWSATDFLDSPERRAAANAFRKEVLNLYVAQLEEYLADEPAWGLEWVDASESSDLLLRLTPPELKALNREVFEVLLKWEARTAAQEHEGREQVQFIFHSFPRRGRLR